MNAFALPDIAAQASRQALPLDWVGMCGVALPVLIEGQQLSAIADLGVSLDDVDARGIHMSRLYLALEMLENSPLSPPLLQRVLLHFLNSHEGLSQAASLTLHTELLLKRPALVSPLSGWKRYPVSIEAHLKHAVFHVELNIQIPYSSTCPCSAALARQLIQQQFVDDFANKSLEHAEVLAWLGSSKGIVATPHSQRSIASLNIRLSAGTSQLPLPRIINQAEAALGTAVQTAVKRADEQAFALANGQNLMFCEDAARRLSQALRQSPDVMALNVRVVHAESLHAHDAVAQSRWTREAA
ncbi:GTP cyclohydrolase FolE2 [Pseudomonas corrugata]|nr:GTP cyclohydrolase FolE2 [Pseudomonas corrugata]MDU9024798.1 GTP cyclohydrolase FolE2 [Pseudomonas corrugata]MDU9038766.1 GTP cyclohydrolase FolE2 [Pseudomonas corrugata]UZD95371.1 GTP cyclohydrolase FolE2 [Pseudomonas corrugata]UZE06297.1 GTP cyclohydrolase FolE2 [Pseudomonas corrugata]SDV08951.1 GTP cyclohydrolase I [Pseudomonas corrugata]